MNQTHPCLGPTACHRAADLSPSDPDLVQTQEIFSFHIRLMMAAFPWVDAPEWKKKSHLSSSRWLRPHRCVRPANVCFHSDNADVSTQPAVWKVCFSSEHLSWFVSQCVKTPNLLLLLLFLLRLSIFGFFQSLLLVLEGKKNSQHVLDAACSASCFSFARLSSRPTVFDRFYTAASRHGVGSDLAELRETSLPRTDIQTQRLFLLFSLVIDEQCDWLLRVKWRYINWNIALGRRYAVQAHRAILLMLQLTLYNTHNPLGFFLNAVNSRCCNKLLLVTATQRLFFFLFGQMERTHIAQ